MTELKLSKKNFSEWFNTIVKEAKIVDQRFPVKGALVWFPYGHKALKLAMLEMEHLLNETNHDEACFPTLVPFSILEKEKDFLKGFGGEAYAVTKAGVKQLDEDLILRPTSEAVMYYMVKLWVRSWKDLPLKLYQIQNVFRVEKTTTVILRQREIAQFKEAHTVHATAKGAEDQIQEGIEIYKKWHNLLAVPFIVLKTPKWDMFAGAEYNYDLFTVMPDGRSLELASVINLGQKFSKAFDITFKDENGEDKFVHQTCYGISERSFGAALFIHGDDKGLIMVPSVAPVQAVIVPILFKDSKENVLTEAKKLEKGLKKSFRVKLDAREELTPGAKFNEWELKGVPVRLELGPKDLKKKQVVLVRRDTGEKKVVKLSEARKEVEKALDSVFKNLKKKADAEFKKQVKTRNSLDDVVKRKDEGGIFKVAWCGDDVCGESIEEKSELNALGTNEKEKVSGKCIGCGAKAGLFLHLARKY